MAKAPGQVAKGISVGLNKGFVTTKLSAKSLRARPSYAKGKLGKRTSLVRQTVRECVGFAPYEKRAIELIKTGMAKDSKRCLKLCKARLGTHRRGLLKKIELEEVVRAQRKK